MRKDRTMCELKRNEIFRFLNQKVEYRVSFIETVLVDREEIPTKIKCQSLSSNRYSTFDLTKRFDYNGSYCEMAFRRVEVKP
jgi:hypothetical protein